MTTNDILRRVRYIFNLNDSKMIELFNSTGDSITRAQISDWLKKDEDPAFQQCSDAQFAIFLNGLIDAKRGKKEGAAPVPEEKLNNNIVFRKLKIAMNLKNENLLELMNLADLRVSKHELSAFFRRPDHKHYRSCKDQILRNFLTGAQLKYRSYSDGNI